MKSLAISALLAIVGFASLAAPASADHLRSNNYYRAPSCGSYGGGGQSHGGHVHVGRGRGNSWSNWNNQGGHNHGRHGGHDHGRSDGSFYFGNRDFSFGVRF